MKAPLLAAALALFAAVASPTHAQTRRGTKPDFPSQNAARTSGTAPQNTPTSASENGKLDYRNPAADPLIPVEADKRKPITDDLQATVTELLALYHESKQAH
jgi:starvation-inducible DNA-binding protein